MIEIEKYTLNNGLRVILHQDLSTPLVAINVLYDVGARDETPDKTGFAHLFEHLMFGGSVNIPNYDEPLQWVGGDNNAFTNNDITNYYLTLPANNLEVGLWLESDRMLQLDFSQESLDVQKGVVVEEFKQRYLNQPYGDVWLKLRPLAYQKHPYQWPTIGKRIEHVQDATLEDVKAFFGKHYIPNNAILVVAGNIDLKKTRHLIQKWFEDIPKGEKNMRSLIQEPKQQEIRKLHVEEDVPQNAIYKVFHMCDRNHPDYLTTDLISDVLSQGNSSRLHQSLLKEKKAFSSIDAYITGDIDPGLFIISGKLHKKTSFEQADDLIQQEIEKLIKHGVQERELEKVKNKVISEYVFSHIDPLNKAMNLAYYELISKAEDLNLELEKYANIKTADLQRVSHQVLQPQNSSTLYYAARK